MRRKAFFYRKNIKGYELVTLTACTDQFGQLLTNRKKKIFLR